MSGNYLIHEHEFYNHSSKLRKQKITTYTQTRSKEPKPLIILFQDKIHRIASAETKSIQMQHLAEDLAQYGIAHAEIKSTQMVRLAKDLVQSGYPVMNVTHYDFDLEKQPEELENICTELYDRQDELIKEFPNKYNGQTIIVGYSKGASLALMMAQHRENNEDLLVPELVIAVAPTDSTYPTKYHKNSDIVMIDGAAFDKDTSTKTCDIFLSPNSSPKMLIIDAFKTTYQDLDPKGSTWTFVKEVIAAQTNAPC
jgi:hypothetical protein